MSGDPYIKENERLEAEIARLRSDLAVEKINNKRLQSERNNAEAEIERLHELLRGTGANRYWEGRWRDAEAALEKIVRNGDQGVHVPTPYDIAKAALAKEGK